MLPPDISPDFPAKPTPDQLIEAVRTCVLALIYSWSIPPEPDENSASMAQIAEFFGLELDSPELECLRLFDEWGNDLMCVAPHFGIAWKAPNWFGTDSEVKMTQPCRLFVPPPRPGPNYYWSLDDAAWVEFHAQDEGDLECSAE